MCNLSNIFGIYVYTFYIYTIIKKQNIMRTNLFTTLLIFISLNIFSQEKARIFAPSFDTYYANLVIVKDGKKDTLKVIQETIMDGSIKMNGRQYNQYADPSIDNGTYTLKKVFRLKPVDLDRFFNETYLAEYFYNDNGKTIIILQKVPNGLVLKN